MATVRNPTLSSSSSFTYEWAYDVFLSFRGEDTREGFTGHLSNDLRKKGIKTFIDDQELRKGDEITPSLMMAIQQSRIAIVIFSKNYASSSFCLEELTEIMECIKHKGRLVWPVFYQVDPSDVRHQRGSYAEALAKHERENIDKEKIKRWSLALQDAANLSGSHFEHGYEYEFVEKITQEVSEKINRKPLHVAKYPVGLESRVQEVNSLLDVESDDGVHMVGIHGMKGLGKTTLARAVYNSIADRFDSLCFLADIRENSMKHGLVQLQEMLLSKLAGLQDVKLSNVNEGIPIIKSRLNKKKILLILDDVNKLEQLEALAAGGQDWFGAGSRIIITTWDKHVLQVHGVEKTYEVQVLNHEESIELFSWNAFKTKEVNPSYIDISNTTILHFDGLPLSLEIIGSDLHGKTVLEWNSALETYERIPHENIMEILKVSYDGLKEIEKKIFLDIACFFKGYHSSTVVDILHSGRGFAPDYAIGVLIDKSLIKIDCDDCVMMHDLIEDMGREIVRLESPLKPGERSRLWFPKDILHVFEENKGSDKTEIIILDLPKHKTVQWDGNALKQMENLKTLVIQNASFSRGPNHLPKSLRVLKWRNYPESSLPAHFNPKKLVTLDLDNSFITFENQPIMKFKRLTKMDLSCCESLKQVPDMSGAPNLKSLQLFRCENLVEVHDSVGFLGKLEHLCLDLCKSLRDFPRGINLPSLKSLSFRGCRSLESFPEILDKMEKLTELNLDHSGISELPFSIGRLVCLDYLAMYFCDELLVLPSSIFMLPRLENLNTMFCAEFERINKGEGICQELEAMSSNVTTHVNFSHCHLSDDFVATLFPFIHHVTTLILDCSRITVLPSSINACRSMKKLTLNGREELREIRGLPPNIEYEFIGKIIQEVPEQISRKPLHVAKYPVGLESRVQEVNSLLDVESDDGVHMVGIHGMGGLGKTTLARAVYNSIAGRFDSLCFLADIRENSMKHGLVQLQRMLLSKLAGLLDVKLSNVNEGIPIIKRMLCRKKILLILDDVDKPKQLKALAGGQDWFGVGSRIIITTKDTHLLQVHGVEKTYEVQVLNHEESIELFSWNAFKTKEVNPSYIDISKTAMLHYNGLPLSLEIIGSYLCGRTVLEWKSALVTYERIPHQNIIEILKVSYDGLNEPEKEIFLDIVCFFKGDHISDIKNILHSSRGFAPDYAISVLIDKSLIKLDGGCVMMHDLIEDMGREIVRLESPLKPGERSRLWFPKDILHVFEENKGSDKTEIIILDLPKHKTVQWDGNALKQMENLKTLVIKNASFSKGPNHLPKSLKVLKWHDYPESSLPAHFNPKKLVTLDLDNSFITFENQPIMKFKRLTKMDLSCCESLKQVPDMSGAPNLKSLQLFRCENLVEVHDSVGFLGKLEHLCLDQCRSLRVFPRGINLPSLKSLSFRGCRSLKSFPEILDNMEKLTELNLNHSGISELPFSIGRLVCLDYLAMYFCDELLVLPSSIFMLPRLENLNAMFCAGFERINKGEGICQELETMSSNVTTHVNFSHCHLSDDFVATLFPFMHHVSTLILDCSRITVLPSSINACHSMKKLMLNDCDELREIRGLPPNIEYLEAKNCISLTSQSKELLLNQTLLNSTSMFKHVCFPESTIPCWLNSLYRSEPSLSFLFRNKFPAIALCVVGFSNPLYGKCFLRKVEFEFDLIINGSQWLPDILRVGWIGRDTRIFPPNHIILLDLQFKDCHDEIGKLHFENEWNLAEISLVNKSETNVDMTWMRVHVLEQETNMEDVQIINPAVPVVEEENKENITHGDEQSR